MICATICFAIFLTLWLALFNAMTGGSPWPMIAAAVLALISPTLLLSQNAPSHQRRI